MNKFILLFVLLSAFQATAQKDSLAKYTTQQLHEKADQISQSANPSIKNYCEEILRRNPTDSIKTYPYLYLGETYAFMMGDEEKGLLFLKNAVKSAKKCNQYQAQKIALLDIAHIYVDQNKNEEALKYVAQLNKVKDPQETYLQSIIFPRTSNSIYGRIGDFKREAAGYRKTVAKIDAYLATHHDIPKQVLLDLDETKYYHFDWLIGNYNYQKKLDSAYYYIQLAKELEKKGIENNGYVPTNGIWENEAFYLILRGKYDDAIAKIATSQKYIKELKMNLFMSYYYLAICWQHKKDYKKSLDYCEKAIATSTKTGIYINPELEILKIAVENAEKLGDVKKTALYSKKYLEGFQKENYAEKGAFIAKLYQNDIILPLSQEVKNNEKKAYFLAIGVAILLLASLYLARGFSKAKRDKKKFLAIIAKMEHQELLKKEQLLEETNIEELPERKQSLPASMSDEADKSITKQLQAFERKQLFLSPNISISSMAMSFNTNVNYLSAAIKKHKITNFNGYINDLRIEYIILKLKNHPEYSNYKIAYLATECGFASHAVFNRAFVQKTGIAPSKFIDYLKSEEFHKAS